LAWWTDVQTIPIVIIPAELVEELNTVWALLAPEPSLPTWAAERKAVGDRAEMYTVQLERANAADPGVVTWVSQDSDSLGWDVEVRTRPPRFIEVKGRRDEQVRFFLSDNEWRKAQRLGSGYEIQFWGGIDLTRSPAVEYAALRAAGWPLIVADPAFTLAESPWSMLPATYRVELITSVSGDDASRDWLLGRRGSLP